MAGLMNKVCDIRENIGKVIVGNEGTVKLLLAGLLADGHVLLEDIPGTGKTVLSKTLARSLDLGFARIQFTPDLLPSDVTGVNYYDVRNGQFHLKKGPVFCNVLLVDEINRATPRTQSALLECMAEKQVSIDGETMILDEPFFVIATQNPVETVGTYPLPEAQVDRFLMKLSMDKMNKAEERSMIDRFMLETPLDAVKPICSREELLRMKAECKEVFLHPLLRDYIVNISQKTRMIRDYVSGVSPRATLAISAAARALAYVYGRDYVVPEDIKELSVPVLAHRLIYERGMTRENDPETLIKLCVDQIEVPTENWSGIR